MLLGKSGRNFLFFKNPSHPISEKDLLPCLPVFVELMLPQKEENDVRFQRRRLQGKNMSFPSSWRGKKKKRRKEKSNDLGSFDGKQMYHSGLTFRLDAKLLLQ